MTRYVVISWGHFYHLFLNKELGNNLTAPNRPTHWQSVKYIIHASGACGKSVPTFRIFMGFEYFFFSTFAGIYNGVEARGGRGGGRGGSSRGSSRGGSRSRSGSSSSSRVRSAISRYRGPKYKSSNWKLGLAAGTVWGLSSYKRRSRYRKHPDRGNAEVKVLDQNIGAVKINCFPSVPFKVNDTLYWYMAILPFWFW